MQKSQDQFSATISTDWIYNELLQGFLTSQQQPHGFLNSNYLFATITAHTGVDTLHTHLFYTCMHLGMYFSYSWIQYRFKVPFKVRMYLLSKLDRTTKAHVFLE